MKTNTKILKNELEMLSKILWNKEALVSKDIDRRKFGKEFKYITVSDIKGFEFSPNLSTTGCPLTLTIYSYLLLHNKAKGCIPACWFNTNYRLAIKQSQLPVTYGGVFLLNWLLNVSPNSLPFTNNNEHSPSFYSSFWFDFRYDNRNSQMVKH